MATEDTKQVESPLTEEESRALHTQKFVDAPGFNQIKDAKLRAQVIDFGMDSGPMIAIQKLQEIVGEEPDYVLGPKTLAALEALPPHEANTRLAKARVRMICKLVQKNPSQLSSLSQWCARALEFI